MKMNKVSITYSRTVQMRQFEPVQVSITLEAMLDVTDKVETVIAQVKKRAKDHVEDEMQRLKVERRESYDNDLEKAI